MTDIHSRLVAAVADRYRIERERQLPVDEAVAIATRVAGEAPTSVVAADGSVLQSYEVMVSGAEPVAGGRGSNTPVWSSDSRTLFFVQADEIRSLTFSVSDGDGGPERMRAVTG